jgi:hypothetical protein
MVIVSHRYNFIYIKNKKVAGSSVESFFGQFCINPLKSYNFKDLIDESISKYGIIGCRLTGEGKNWFSHKKAIQIREDLGNTIFDKYVKFCVIRNPYEKMVSLYYYMNTKMSFLEFVKKYNCNNVNIHSIDGKSVCDYFIRYENLKEDIIKLCKILKIKDHDISLLPHHKKSNCNKQYSYLYNKESKKIVFEKHKIEFKLFNYKFETK